MVKGGPSLNPAGRSRGFKGVAKLIATETRDGAELVEWALSVFRDPDRTYSERAAAHQWLSDRYLGKPLSSHEIVAAVATHTIGPPAGWDAMPLEQRRAILNDVMNGSRLALAPAADEDDA
jgi:hypothetical protein